MLRTIAGAGPAGATVSAAAVVDCTVRVGVVLESDVAHRTERAATKTIVAANATTTAMTDHPGARVGESVRMKGA